MEKYRDPRDERNMIIVFMWIFVRVVSVSMVTFMRSEYFFDNIDDKKSGDKCIDSKLSLFECLWKYMNE